MVPNWRLGSGLGGALGVKRGGGPGVGLEGSSRRRRRLGLW